MNGPDDDLQTLIERSDHLRVLQYIRAHKLRKPEWVLHHGKLLFGPSLDKYETKHNFSGRFQSLFSHSRMDESERFGALEQICIAALDVQDLTLAKVALNRIGSVVSSSSIRYRRLLALSLEASKDLEGAMTMYNEMRKDNASNFFAIKRKYCVLRAMKKDFEARELLNDYLEKNGCDVGAWIEMAKSCAEVGDYAGAAYCYEEIVLACPLDASVHCQLAEYYITMGGKDNLKLARKHMAQSLDLMPEDNLRAVFGLISAAEEYLDVVHESLNRSNNNNSARKVTEDEEEDIQVAKELIRFGTDHLLKAYSTGSASNTATGMNAIVESFVKDIRQGLDAIA